jgi:tRNA nucleotidyltransferase (CCA-adding enzyme)
MQEVLSRGLAELPAHTDSIQGYQIAVWPIQYEQFLTGLSGVVNIGG